MKAKRRHELKHNTLDDELGKLVAFFRKYGTYVAWAVLGGAVVFLVVSYASSRASAREIEVLNRFQKATTDSSLKPDEQLNLLRELAEQDVIPPIAARCCLLVADGYAARRAAAGSDPITAMDAEQHEKNAKRYYERAISDFGDMPSIVARAHLGLGKLAETRRRFDVAERAYQTVKAMPAVAKMPAARMADEYLAELPRLRQAVEMPDKAPQPKPDTTPKLLRVLPTSGPATTTAPATSR